MGYVADLRALVGHRPLLLVGGGVSLVDKQGRLLLQRRSDDDTWGIVGGAVELGESVEDAARREVREETGLEIGQVTLYEVYSGPDCFHTYPNGDQAYIVSIILLCDSWTGEPVITEESKEVRFFSPSELQTLDLTRCSGPNRAAIQDWRVAVYGCDDVPPPGMLHLG
jgi:ADP-ribose pyrophosphatase YjhB (NUDIX family)